MASALFRIRPAGRGDQAAAFVVCLQTGDAGRDATRLYADDPDALGRVYVGPYLRLEPDLAFLLDDALGVCGYVLGALDSRRFYQRRDAEWSRQCQDGIPLPSGDPSQWSPSQRLHAFVHRPSWSTPEPYANWPSHLHLDLLPRAQGQGWGRRMVTTLLTTLRARGSCGVHLSVWHKNERAIGFYRRLGFRDLESRGEGDDAELFMGLTL